jgi:hypothetical protein
MFRAVSRHFRLGFIELLENRGRGWRRPHQI